MARNFDNSDYVDVAERIVEFREKHPEGCLRPLNPDKPYDIVTVGDKTFIVVVAAAYRDPVDPTPGVGMAWEPFPGPTPFTKNSELQNAETSAWGRALVAVLAADTKRGVASANEVRNRSVPTGPPVGTNGNGGTEPDLAPRSETTGSGSPELVQAFIEAGKAAGHTKGALQLKARRMFPEDAQATNLNLPAEKLGQIAEAMGWEFRVKT